jgi:ribosome maturation factor RimP
MTAEQDSIAALVRPLADARGADLVDVEIKGTGGRRLVRVIIARKGGVEVEDLSEVSRDLSALLDEQDPIEGTYALEVTSPGVDYPLRDRAAFGRVEGLAVDLHRTVTGASAQLRGTVRAAEDDAVVLDVDGQAVRVPYDDIVKATQALPW